MAEDKANGKGGGGDERPAKRDPIVQLGRNAAGRQAGETFRASQAKALGIDEECRPFKPDTHRAIDAADKTR